MKRVPPPRRATKADPLEQKIEAALQPGYFIKYDAGWSFVEGLDRVEDKIAKLVRIAPARAVALYETFLAGCYEKAAEPERRQSARELLAGKIGSPESERLHCHQTPLPVTTSGPFHQPAPYRTVRGICLDEAASAGGDPTVVFAVASAHWRRAKFTA